MDHSWADLRIGESASLGSYQSLGFRERMFIGYMTHVRTLLATAGLKLTHPSLRCGPTLPVTRAETRPVVSTLTFIVSLRRAPSHFGILPPAPLLT
jgi:hypothetical protein